MVQNNSDSSMRILTYFYKKKSAPKRYSLHVFTFNTRVNSYQGRRISPFLAFDFPRFFLEPGAQVTSVVSELSELCSDPGLAEVSSFSVFFNLGYKLGNLGYNLDSRLQTYQLSN